MRWSGRRQAQTTIENQSGTVAIEGYLPFERVIFVEKTISFPLAESKLKGDVLTNRQSGAKMFIAAITAPIYGASN
jgi:hypothetical protein